MVLKISDIFNQKLMEIQNRVPVQISKQNASIPFMEYLDNTSTNSVITPSNKNHTDNITDNIKSQVDRLRIYSSSSKAIDKEGNDRSTDVARAKAALVRSNAHIPDDKNELSQLINYSIETASSKYNVDKNLIKAVIKQESNSNPYALSKTGAQGLMQLMPDTADALGVSDPWDIFQNIDGGTKYLRDQILNFNGNLEYAVAAYNAGGTRVRQYNGIPPYPETQNYVKKVMEYYKSLSFKE